MTVSEILARADALGVRLYADGSELKAQWCADAPPPPEFVALLKSSKPNIRAALLELRSFRWHEHFEERAAIREYEGNQSRPEAELGALGDCISRWRAENPLPPATRFFCVHCGAARSEGSIGSQDNCAWLHRACWTKMDHPQREAARGEVLARLNLVCDFEARQETSTLREKLGEGA